MARRLSTSLSGSSWQGISNISKTAKSRLSERLLANVPGTWLELHIGHSLLSSFCILRHLGLMTAVMDVYVSSCDSHDETIFVFQDHWPFHVSVSETKIDGEERRTNAKLDPEQECEKINLVTVKATFEWCQILLSNDHRPMQLAFRG
jgi:hypothetical protein